MYEVTEVNPKQVGKLVYFEDEDCLVHEADKAWLRRGWYFKYYRTEEAARGD